MFKLHTLALVTALCAVTACNKDKTQREANRAAEAVNDKTKDLREEARDLRETSNDDRAELADKVQDHRNALKDDLKDVADNAADRAEKIGDKATSNVKDVADETKDMTKEVASLESAQNEFVYQRNVRVQTLRAVHAIDASQPILINTLNTSVGFIAEDQAKIALGLKQFQLRLDEAGKMIQGLETVDAASWAEREKAAADAMNRLEDSRSDAWQAVEDAKRDDTRTSMR